MNILIVVLKSIGSIIALFLLTKMMGKKQISQLNLFDYITGITIGSIAAEICVESDREFWASVIAIFVYAFATFLISVFTTRNIHARRFFYSTPTFIMENGKLIEKNMRRLNFDLSDLLSECRVQGVFDLSQVWCAIMETNGHISLLLKSENRPLVPSDVGVRVSQEGFCANVIIDGHIMPNNLKAVGLNEEWLKRALKELHAPKPEEILLASVDTKGVLSVFDSSQQPRKYNPFE